MSFSFTSDYAYCLLAASIMSFHCFIQGFHVGKLRRELGLAYPDMGCGRYSAKLTDEQWLKFNCVQRAHQNYLEVLPMFLLWIAIGGLYYPTATTALTATAIAGRQIYAMGYRGKGPSGREIGAGISGVAFLGLFVTSVMTCLKMANLLQ